MKIEIGGKYLLYRDKVRGWGMVEVIGHQGDWLVRAREVVGGLEYPVDPCNLRLVAQAASKVFPNQKGVREIRSNGKLFFLKRHNRTTYSLFQEGVESRSRWGDKAQMLEDIAIVLQYGVLPTPGGVA